MKKALVTRKKAEAIERPLSADDLKKIRASFGMSQAQFARLLRVEKSWLTKREQGVNRMSASDTALYRALIHIKKYKCLKEWLGDC